MQTAIVEAGLESADVRPVLSDMAAAVATVGAEPLTEAAILPLMEHAQRAHTWHEQFFAVPEPSPPAATPTFTMPKVTPTTATKITSPSPVTSSDIAPAPVDPNAWKTLPTMKEQLHGHFAWKPVSLDMVTNRMRPLLRELRDDLIKKAVERSRDDLETINRTKNFAEKLKLDADKLRAQLLEEIRTMDDDITAWVRKAAPDGMLRDRVQFSSAMTYFMTGIQMLIVKNEALFLALGERGATMIAMDYCGRLRTSALATSGNRPSGHFRLAPNEEAQITRYMTMEAFPTTANNIAADMWRGRDTLSTELAPGANANDLEFMSYIIRLTTVLRAFGARFPCMHLHNVDMFLYAVDCADITMNALIESLPGGTERYPQLRNIVRRNMTEFRDAAHAAYVYILRERDNASVDVAPDKNP